MDAQEQREIISQMRKIPSLADVFGAPTMAWPTIVVLLVSFGGFGATAYALLTGLLSPFITVPLGAFFVFWSFTPLHEAVHRNLSSTAWLNDTIGTISAQLLLPGFSTSLYRFLHITHHARAGQADDPDIKFNNQNLLLCWLSSAFLDVLWTRFYFSVWSERPTAERARFALGLVLYVAMFAVAFTSPYALEFTLAFLLPMFLGRIVTVYLFATIQHQEGHEQRHDPFGATWMQDVHSQWWQRLLLLGQSQHLIHHLYTNVPWYHYDRIWREAQTRIPTENIRWGGYLSRKQKPFRKNA